MIEEEFYTEPRPATPFERAAMALAWVLLAAGGAYLAYVVLFQFIPFLLEQ